MDIEDNEVISADWKCERCIMCHMCSKTTEEMVRTFVLESYQLILVLSNLVILSKLDMRQS